MPAPQPQHLGPRPLPLHWNIYLTSLLSSAPGLLLLNSNLLPSQSPQLQSLAQRLSQLPANQLGPALAKASASKLQQFLCGVERYHHYPRTKPQKAMPIVWQDGSSQLLRYGKSGVPVLVLPSLINRGYILDLDAQRSWLRSLTTQGLCPYLLEWGEPATAEHDYTLTDYANRAARALKFIGQPVQLVGYCMGGLLALKLSEQHPRLIRQLTLLATPWDFHAPSATAAQRAASLYRLWQPGLQGLPVDLIQTLFTLLDPLGPAQKFARFAELPDGPEADAFVALEDWLNDGVTLTARVADTCLIDWYERNAAHEFVNPSQVQVPTLVMIPQQDKIVPPESAEALAARLPDCRRLRVPLGHIGMMVSHHAPEVSWKPLAKWLGAD
jgi:polyhydroxyalkanoate synthase subunit PhaC